MSQNRIEEWEIAIAKRRVKNCRDRWDILKAEGFDDLVQDCLIYWLEQKAKYDPSRGASQKTFMARVIELYLSHRKDALLRKKRKAFFEAKSLDEYFVKDADSSSENHRHEPSTSEDPDIRMDISHVIAKLKPHQKEICRLIWVEGMSLNQISKHLNKHHSYVYREAERIRQVFEQEGFSGYSK